MRPTFSGIFTARSGIQAARANLDVTGQNLGNLSTEGYCRQRLDTTSLGGSALGMRYADTAGMNIGQGVCLNSVGQIRDSFLDLRYRLANAPVGEMAVAADTKASLDAVINEIPDDNGLQAQINKLISNLDSLNSNQGNTSNEAVVKGDVKQIAQMFRDWSLQMSTIKKNTLGSFKTDAIDKVNSLLENITVLNKEIKESDVVGVGSPELQDQRNQKLDELSQYMNIEVSYNSVSVGAGKTVPEMSINLLGTDGKKFELLNHDKCGKFSLKQGADGNAVEEPVVLQLTNAKGTNMSTNGNVAFDNSQIKGGQFKSYLMLLNDNGEYDAAVKTDLLTNLDTKTTRINSLLSTINNDNQKIAANDAASKDYEKERTEAIAELKTYMDVKITKNAADNRIMDISVNTTGSDVSLLSATESGGVITYEQANLTVKKDPIKGYPASLEVTNGAGTIELDETSLTNGSVKYDIYRLNADPSVSTSSATEHGIGYYQKRLDTLAASFAQTLNSVNSTNKKTATEDYNKPLVSNGDGSSSTIGITAANISIAQSWTDMKGSYITVKKDQSSTSNILYLKSQLQSDMDYTTPEGAPLFTGSILKYATNMANTVGKETNSASNLQSSYSSDLVDIDKQRKAVSSVSVDDEGINLIMFGQALTASSRVMTTMDEELDVIINKMGRVGN